LSYESYFCTDSNRKKVRRCENGRRDSGTLGKTWHEAHGCEFRRGILSHLAILVIAILVIAILVIILAVLVIILRMLMTTEYR
jgi:hypothetical protein